MLTYDKIYKAYKSVGIHSFLFEAMASNNRMERQCALKEIDKLNFKTEDDVVLYIALSI